MKRMGCVFPGSGGHADVLRLVGGGTARPPLPVYTELKQPNRHCLLSICRVTDASGTPF